LIDEVLIGEWGFDGFVISDWWSVKSTVETGLHGVDLEMPGPRKYLGSRLAQAVHDGTVPEEAVDAKLRRLLGVMDDLGVLEEAGYRPDESHDRPEDRVLLRRAATEAVVLLSNDGVLPLDPNSLTSVAVIGPNADVAIIQGGGSAAVNPHHAVTVLDGLRARLGDGVRITHERGCDSFRSAPPLDPRWTEGSTFHLDYFDNRELEGDPVHSQDVGSARMNWLGDPWPGVPGGNFSARLTATFVAPETGQFTFALVAGGRGRVFIDDDQVLDMWDQWKPGTAFFGLGSEEIRTTVTLQQGERRELRMEISCMEKLKAAAGLLGCIGPMADDPIGAAARAAADADVAVVVVGLNMEWETEGVDRISMDLPGQQDELIRAVAAANHRTVVLVNAGSPTSMPWADDVGAVAQMWYLGQESGDAVADLLVGDVSPSGHLPTTFPRRYEDHPATLNYPGESGQVLYGEGIFVGYRGFDRMWIEPRFPFGHGLTYTTFEYGSASVDSGTIEADGTVTVSVPVTNTGDRAGAEVVQVYVADPVSSLVRPPQELKGFAKVQLAPGESSTVSIELSERAFSYWDPSVPGWVCEPGEFELRVGASSRDVRTTVTVNRAEPATT
jgi:beta-glucosidase